MVNQCVEIEQGFVPSPIHYNPITPVILKDMKTAVSIPDPIFQAAEDLDKRLGLSRSELFARALKAYVTVRLPEMLILE